MNPNPLEKKESQIARSTYAENSAKLQAELELARSHLDLGIKNNRYPKYKNSPIDFAGIYNILGDSKSVPIQDATSADLSQRLQALEALYVDLQPKSFFSKGLDKAAKFFSATRGSAREKMKDLLKVKDIQKTVDPLILKYLEAQQAVIAHELAYQNACKQKQLMDNAIANNSDAASFEVLTLNRHARCTDRTKVGGLRPDAPLTINDKQTPFHLKSAQLVQSGQVEYMQDSKAIGHVYVKVSPVSRAYQTLSQAGLTPAVVHRTQVSNDLAETQKYGRLISSGRASQGATDVAKEKLQDYQATGLSAELIPSETPEEFAERRERALKLITSPLLKEQGNPPPQRTVVGHGGMNKELLKAIRKDAEDKGIKHDIPEKPESLGFSCQYNLILIRNAGNEIIEIQYNGIYDRFGQPVPSAKNLLNQCMRSPEEEVSKIINNHAELLLNNLDCLSLENSERSTLIINALLNAGMVSNPEPEQLALLTKLQQVFNNKPVNIRAELKVIMHDPNADDLVKDFCKLIQQQLQQPVLSPVAETPPPEVKLWL